MSDSQPLFFWGLVFLGDDGRAQYQFFWGQDCAHCQKLSPQVCRNVWIFWSNRLCYGGGAHLYLKLDIILVKIHVIRVVFRTRQCTRVHCLGVQKRAELEKRVCFCHIDKFWKEHDEQIRKKACKMHIYGLIFMPEKYVFRVCFENPFTRMISSLK